MEVGDKLYCINTIIDIYNEISFIENKCYKITYISSTNLTIIDETGEKWFFAIINQSNDKYKLKDHFSTLQQYRKLKLQKLNETR